MNSLTLRQQEILGFIRIFARDQGYWPSIREIQQHFGFKSTNAVAGHLLALERKGALARVPGQARAYRIAGDAGENGGHTLAGEIDVVEIPVYGNIAAGFPEGVESGNAIARLQIDVETAGVARGGRSFALRVRGESMIDAGIFDGDTVILEVRPPHNGDIVAALIDGETTLKRYLHPRGESPYLKAENHAFPSIHPINELLVQGVATSVVRRL